MFIKRLRRNELQLILNMDWVKAIACRNNLIARSEKPKTVTTTCIQQLDGQRQ
jgi:hypothetical protein